MDHRPSKPGRFPKNLEDKLKKKMKRQIRNKSFSGIRPIKNQYYDEDKIFPNVENNISTNNNNENDYNMNNLNNTDKYPYQNRDYLPSAENSMRRPYGNTAMDGFGRPYLNPENNINGMNNSMNINTSPLDMNNQNPNLNYRMPPNTLGINNSRNNFEMIPNNEMARYNEKNSQNNNNSTKNNNSVSGPNATGSNFSSSTLKNQILNKRMMKESTRKS